MAKTNENELTFEDVDKHFKKVDLSEFKAGGVGAQAVSASAVNPLAALQAVCRAYKVIKPFLNLILNVPLIPGSWKSAIRVFVNLMNGICP
jgi:hypothetical protein